jgi:DNA-binding CsgD family transcriptional regulator
MTVITETRPLTTSQRQLLKMISEGLTHKEVAQRLGIHHGTVGVRMSHIYRKLGVHNWRDACIAAGMSAFVEPVDPGTSNIDVMGDRMFEVVRKHRDDKTPTLGLIVDAARALGVEFEVKRKQEAA